MVARQRRCCARSETTGSIHRRMMNGEWASELSCARRATRRLPGLPNPPRKAPRVGVARVGGAAAASRDIPEWGHPGGRDRGHPAMPGSAMPDRGMIPAMPPKPTAGGTVLGVLDVQAFLKSAGMPARTVRFPTDAVIFSQGTPANSVFYLQQGGVKLSVLSAGGKEAVVAILGPADFFGEGCLAGQPSRMGTATAVDPAAVLRIHKRDMLRILHERPEFSDRFIAHMLARNIRIEEDLVDHLFNSSEKRLARTLLLLARYGSEDGAPRPLPKLSQETLAEMVGTTRSRVNFFMNKFRKLGFIEYNGGLKVNRALLSIVLHA
jgi:CRP/FNR family cyclic AMP-dependent transcriptional regulator